MCMGVSVFQVAASFCYGVRYNSNNQNHDVSESDGARRILLEGKNEIEAKRMLNGNGLVLVHLLRCNGVVNTLLEGRECGEIDVALKSVRRNER